MLIHVVPLALVLSIDAAPGYLLALAVAIAASWASLRRHPVWGFGPKAIRRVRRDAAGQWRITVGDREFDVELQSSSRAHPLVILLCYQSERGRWSRLILSSDIDPEAHRRLRASIVASQS